MFPIFFCVIKNYSSVCEFSEIKSGKKIFEALHYNLTVTSYEQLMLKEKGSTSGDSWNFRFD
jgi:hypothetical protein